MLLDRQQTDGFDAVVQDFISAIAPGNKVSKALSEERYIEASKDELDRSFRAFMPAAWNQISPAPFQSTWHMDAIADCLQAVSDGQIRRLIINQPPGTAKSTITSVLYPAWEWGPRNKPQTRFLVTSYSASGTLFHATQSRALMRGDWYQSRWRSRFAFSQDQDAKSLYANTRGGYRYTVGMTGSITGQRADTMVIDDPNQRDDKLNMKALEDSIATWNTQLRPCLSGDNAAVVVTMSRLNESDMTGYFMGRMEEDGWVCLRLPRLFEPTAPCRVFVGGELFFQDPRSREDEPLTPDGNGFKSYRTVVLEREEGGEFNFASVEQQRPMPLKGGIIKGEWLTRWHRRGSCESVPSGLCAYCLPDTFDVMALSWDCAFKSGEDNSWVVGQVWGRRGAFAYLLDQVRGHWGLPDTLKQFKAQVEKWPTASAKLVEAKANGPAVVQMFDDTIPGLIPVEVQGGKISRMGAVSPFFESHHVLIPMEQYAPWVPKYASEVTTFPKGTNNDQADATSQGVWYLLGGSLRQSEGFKELNTDVPRPPFTIPTVPGSNGHAESTRGRVESGYSGGTPAFDLASLTRLFRG